MDFEQFWGFGVQFCPKKWVSPTFQSDRQVNPENRPSKDSKTAAVSDFAKIFTVGENKFAIVMSLQYLRLFDLILYKITIITISFLIILL